MEVKFLKVYPPDWADEIARRNRAYAKGGRWPDYDAPADRASDDDEESELHTAAS